MRTSMTECPGSTAYVTALTRRDALRHAAEAIAGTSVLAAAACRIGGRGIEGPPPSQQPVTLRFIPGGLIADMANQVIEAFQAEHRNITVEIEPITGDYNDKINTLRVAGQLPDVIYTSDARVKPFVANQVAANMEALAAKDKASQELLRDVYPVMLNLGRTRLAPGLYMLPWSLDVLVLYYNKTMFQSAGVEFPKPTWTVDDLILAARKLTREAGEPATSQYGVNLNWTWWAEYVPWMRGYGGDILSADGRRCTLDDPRSIEGIQAMADLVLKHRVAPPPGTNFGGDPFQLGRVGMIFGIRNTTAVLRRTVKDTFDWDVELRPAFPVKRVTGMGTAGWTVTTQTKHPNEAWQLAKFLISPTAQRIFAQSYANVPVLQSMRNDPAWRSLPPPPTNNDAFARAADYGTLPPEFPAECGSVYTGDVQKIINEAITAILTGVKGTAAALRDAAAQINACIAAHPESK